MRCQKCNKEIPDNSKFCPFCGNVLEQAVQEWGPPHNQSSKGRKRAKSITISVIAGLVIIISGVSLFYYFKVYEGDFMIEQAQETFELGKKSGTAKNIEI